MEALTVDSHFCQGMRIRRSQTNVCIQQIPPRPTAGYNSKRIVFLPRMRRCTVGRVSPHRALFWQHHWHSTHVHVQQNRCTFSSWICDQENWLRSKQRRDSPLSCQRMDEIEQIENSDEGLRDPSTADTPPKKGKKKTRHKATRGSKRRPRSANLLKTAANSSSSNRPGVDAKLGNENTERQRQQREGSRMRGDGQRISRNVNSASAPQLLMRNTTPGIAGDRKRGDENTTGSVHEEGGGRRLFDRRRTPSAVNNVDGVADLDVEEEGELEKAQQSIKDTTRSLQELGLQKQEIELRHRQMENRCTQLEGAGGLIFGLLDCPHGTVLPAAQYACLQGPWGLLL